MRVRGQGGERGAVAKVEVARDEDHGGGGAGGVVGEVVRGGESTLSTERVALLWENGNNEDSSSRARRAQWRGKGVARVRKVGILRIKSLGTFSGAVRGYSDSSIREYASWTLSVFCYRGYSLAR